MTTTTPDDASPAAVGPRWASLASADPHTVASFYRAVLGWAITETNGRLIASSAGTPVADIADITVADGIPGWLIHFDVDGLDTALTAVSNANGAVLPPADGDSAETAGPLQSVTGDAPVPSACGQSCRLVACPLA